MLSLARNPNFLFSIVKSPPWIPRKFGNCYRLRSAIKPSSTAMENTSSSDLSSASAIESVSIGESLSRRLWQKSHRESMLAAYTPFVLSMASGTLELETFRHYIAQDIHFLRAFLQAYEMAEKWAADVEVKKGICELKMGVLEEMKMHDSVVQEWGVDVSKENTPNYATDKYTDFLRATASGEVEGGKRPGKIATNCEKSRVAAYTLGAMTPCMRLYAFLGKKLQPFLDLVKSGHPYKEWIDNYSSPSFEAAALQTEELLDKLSITLVREEIEVIERLYHQAMKLEIEFFTAQPMAQKTLVPLARVQDAAERRLVLFSDFDLTCTVVDSCAVLAEIAISTASKSGGGLDNSIVQRSSVDLKNSWNMLSRQYDQEHEQCIESIMPSEKAEAFDYVGLYGSLERLSQFEQRANSRVIESGVLKGLRLEDIEEAGHQLILQDGCTEFFQHITKARELDVDIHILSFSWCGDLVRSTFSSRGLHVNVHSNEFTYWDSVSTGELIRKLESPIDKVQSFKKILKSSGGDGKHLSIYVGDSLGDLLCLLEADLGIIIGSSSTLQRVASQFGVSFVPLFSGLVVKQRELVQGYFSNWKGQNGALFTVSSWAEIHALILGS